MYRVITYNVLSSELATTHNYPQSRPGDLPGRVRLDLLKYTIAGWIRGLTFRDTNYHYEQEAILPLICLQELSLEWTGELTGWFLNVGYVLISTNYGSYHGGYMGVAIAVPSTLRVQRVEIGLPTGNLNWPRDRTTHGRSRVHHPNGQDVDNAEEEETAVWDSIKRKYNRYIAVKLCGWSQVPFWLATYHMPCAWRRPSLLVVMTTLLARRLSQLVGDEPLVLAGDFNFQPNSEAYQLLIGGLVTPFSVPSKFAPLDWDGRLDYHLRAVPPLRFTCRGYASPAFEGTLDHIFYSDGYWARVEAEESHLPTGPTPSREHPSDHVPVIARFYLRSESPTGPNYAHYVHPTHQPVRVPPLTPLTAGEYQLVSQVHES